VIHKDLAIVGVVLAGGKSSRMGSDKSWLPLDGGNLIDHMINVLNGVSEPLKLDRILISGTRNGYNCVPDLTEAKGPLGGIYSVVDYLQGSAAGYVLIVPVDMPRLASSLLEKLILEIGDDTDALGFESYELPLLLRVTPSLAEILSSRVLGSEADSDCSIRGLINSIESFTEVPVCIDSSSKQFINVNTLEEWNTFLSSREVTSI